MLCKYSGAIFIHGSNIYYYIRGHLLYMSPYEYVISCVTQTGSGVLWKVRFRLRITLSTLNYKVVYLREIFCPQNGDNREPCFIVSFWDFVSLAIVFTLCLRETKVFMFYACNFPHDVSNMLKLSPALWICHITSSSNLTSEENFLFPPSHPGG